MKNGKIKKLTALLLTVTMLLCFAACGESESETEEKKDSAGASASDSANVDSNENDYAETINPEDVDTEDERVGTYITFGTYEQDGDTTNGAEPIEWLVLGVKGNKTLVISKYGLDAKAYNEERKQVNWEICTLRKWLNNDFYSTAFSSIEQGSIATVNVIAEANDYYGTEAGNDTQDKVFLLSESEAGRYFSSDEERICKPTQYAIDQDVVVLDKPGNSYNGNSFWWLRTPGEDISHSIHVSYDGGVSGGGASVQDSRIAVRPAMWVELG